MKQCTHADALPHPEPEPLSETCPECLAAGTHPVQLRLCLECGHVGLLRLLADAARDRAPQGERPSDHADVRAGRELALVLRRPCTRVTHRTVASDRDSTRTMSPERVLVSRFDRPTSGYVNPARALPIWARRPLATERIHRLTMSDSKGLGSRGQDRLGSAIASPLNHVARYPGGRPSAPKSLYHLGGEGVPDRRRARDPGLRGSPAAGRGCLPVGAAYGHGRPRGPFGLHPRRDRGPAHRGGRGLRDPASAGRARLGAQLCLPPGRRLAGGHGLGPDHGRPRPRARHLRLDRAVGPGGQGRPPPWPRTKPFRSASTNSAARDPGRREERGRAGAGRRARHTGASRRGRARRSADGPRRIGGRRRRHPRAGPAAPGGRLRGSRPERLGGRAGRRRGARGALRRATGSGGCRTERHVLTRANWGLPRASAVERLGEGRRAGL